MNIFFKEGPTPRLWLFLIPVGFVYMAVHFILKYW